MRRGLRWFVMVSVALAAACGADGLLQGDDYMPNETLPIEPASTRPEGGSSCNGDGGDAGCDASAGADAPVMIIADGATPPSNTCQTARAIGTTSGDTGAQTISTTGKCSEWISFRATEDSSSVFGQPMKATVTLSPSGHDFDLYVYFNPSKDVVSCLSPYAQSETRGMVDEVLPLTWGESSVANNSDDGRTIVVAVQSAEGPCPANAGWSLTVDGNR